MSGELTREEQWLLDVYRHHKKNLVSVICTFCGWLPLKPGKEMTVHFNGVKYTIKAIDKQKGDNE